jgi:hypothetical protein
MIENNLSSQSEPDKNPGAPSPVMKSDTVLTPKAEARAANKLPRREQLGKFEQELEAKDSGNQPS